VLVSVGVGVSVWITVGDGVELAGIAVGIAGGMKVGTAASSFAARGNEAKPIKVIEKKRTICTKNLILTLIISFHSDRKLVCIS
jgi:hypothetical protein